MSKTRVCGYDLQFCNIDDVEGRERGKKVDWSEKDGYHHWIATTVKPIYSTQKLIGLGARGRTKLTATLRLILLMAIIGPQHWEEGGNIPIF